MRSLRRHYEEMAEDALSGYPDAQESCSLDVWLGLEEFAACEHHGDCECETGTEFAVMVSLVVVGGACPHGGEGHQVRSVLQMGGPVHAYVDDDGERDFQDMVRNGYEQAVFLLHAHSMSDLDSGAPGA